MGKVLVVHHGDCIDGLSSAWVFDRKWGGGIAYLPYIHHRRAEGEASITDALAQGDTLYFVDVAPEKDFLDRLMQDGKAESIHVIDHHKTAAEALSGYVAPASGTRLTLTLDPARPACARMVWEHAMGDAAAPAYFAVLDKMDRGDGLVSDADFAAAALVDSYGVGSMDVCAQLSALALQDMVAQGGILLAEQKSNLESMEGAIMNAQMKGAGDVLFPVVNASVRNFGRAIDPWLRALAAKANAPAAFAWHVQGNGAVSMSVRTREGFDASTIARDLCAQASGVTGGGHPTAAAVQFPSLRVFLDVLTLTPVRSGNA